MVGYLVELMQTCQSVLSNIRNYETIKPYLLELCGYYSDLQIHKHVRKDEREERLRTWYETHKSKLPEMDWYEFSACSGSTLGIFCLVSYAMRPDFEASMRIRYAKAIFPIFKGFIFSWIILLIKMKIVWVEI